MCTAGTIENSCVVWMPAANKAAAFPRHTTPCRNITHTTLKCVQYRERMAKKIPSHKTINETGTQQHNHLPGVWGKATYDTCMHTKQLTKYVPGVWSKKSAFRYTQNNPQDVDREGVAHKIYRKTIHETWSVQVAQKPTHKLHVSRQHVDGYYAKSTKHMYTHLDRSSMPTEVLGSLSTTSTTS